MKYKMQWKNAFSQNLVQFLAVLLIKDNNPGSNKIFLQS